MEPLESEQGLWPRFVRVQNAVRRIWRQKRSEIQRIEWTGWDAGTVDINGYVEGKSGDVEVRFKAKGTSYGSLRGNGVGSKITGHMTFEGDFVSKDRKGGRFLVTRDIGRDTQLEAYWLQTATGVTKLEQVVVNGRVYDAESLAKNRRGEVEIPGAHVGVDMYVEN
jgi:hypothetical protein